MKAFEAPQQCENCGLDEPSYAQEPDNESQRVWCPGCSTPTAPYPLEDCPIKHDAGEGWVYTKGVISLRTNPRSTFVRSLSGGYLHQESQDWNKSYILCSDCHGTGIKNVKAT